MPRTRQKPLSVAALLERGRPLIMGVVNATPDSFHDGGFHFSSENAVHHALALAETGADILDVGGESTRPGSQGVDAREEFRRVVPVIEALSERVEAPISIDTSKAEVAKAALAAGASILNDVTALRGDPGMARLAADAGCPVVLMHMKGTTRDMQKDPRYDDVVGEVEAFLKERLEAFAKAGGDRTQALVDPGLGFGKTLDHNLALLRAVPRLAALAPVVIGASRKAFLGRLRAGQKPGERDLPPSDLPPTSERLVGSVAVALYAAHAGASVVRVHDAAETREALDVWRAVSADW